MATILVVEDRPVNRRFVVTLLQDRGHRLLEAADSEGALRYPRASGFFQFTARAGRRCCEPPTPPSIGPSSQGVTVSSSGTGRKLDPAAGNALPKNERSARSQARGSYTTKW